MNSSRVKEWDSTVLGEEYDDPPPPPRSPVKRIRRAFEAEARRWSSAPSVGTAALQEHHIRRLLDRYTEAEIIASFRWLNEMLAQFPDEVAWTVYIRNAREAIER